MATKNGEKLLYEDVSYIVRGTCFDLYKKFGGVFKESFINRALVAALKQKNLKVETQKRIDIIYNGEKIGVYVPDINLDDKILIELKVKPFLIKEDDRQFWYYLKGLEYKLGFLMNFGTRKLEIKRRIYIYDKARESNPCLSASKNIQNPRSSASINKAFTLVELLIAVGLFIAVISIASVAFIQGLRIQRSTAALMEVNDNVSLVLEQMSREIRTGYRFCAADAPILNLDPVYTGHCDGLADNELAFINALDQEVSYRFEDEAIWKKVVFLGIPDDKKITADNVKINYFNIALSGNDANDDLQPRITISLSVSPTTVRDIKDVKINIQTTISPRLIKDE